VNRRKTSNDHAPGSPDMPTKATPWARGAALGRWYRISGRASGFEAVAHWLAYQVLSAPLDHLSNTTMTGAGMPVELPVIEGAVAALRRGSVSTPLKSLGLRAL
jgi:hypothetical protein